MPHKPPLLTACLEAVPSRDYQRRMQLVMTLLQEQWRCQRRNLAPTSTCTQSPTECEPVISVAPTGAAPEVNNEDRRHLCARLERTSTTE